MIAINKDRYIKPTKEEGNEIVRLEGIFFENEHELLRGGKVKKKDRESIDHLYYKFFRGIDNHDWSGSCIDMELRNLKNDGICKNNSNKVLWSKSILLAWYLNIAKSNRLTASDLFQSMQAREAMRKMISYFYKEVSR